jgi:uncharacterized protein YcbK (DUF882 family)
MTPNFTVAGDPKLTCSCGCGMLPQQDFMDKMQRLRLAFGKPMKVSSAARCPEYNAKVSATKSRTGPHTTGRAIDFECSHQDADKILELSYTFGLGITGRGINQKGTGRFIHLDDLPDAPGQPRPHLWSY